MSEGFDLRTHIRDPKSGRIIIDQPYRLYISKDGVRVFERPPGSGNKFYENGEKIPTEQSQVLVASPAEAKMESKVENKTKSTQG